MELTNSFKVDLPPEQAWEELMNIPQVAACVPGAELTDSLPADAYKGKMTFKLGPIVLNFQGTVQITERDDENRTALLLGKGSDAKGRGNASSKTKVQILASGGGSEVHLDTALQLSGMIAQYGRASGVIKAVSDELITQFSWNLQNTLANKGSSGLTPQTSEETEATVAAPVESTIGAGFVFQAMLRWFKGLLGRKGKASSEF